VREAVLTMTEFGWYRSKRWSLGHPNALIDDHNNL
jgi:hypothetical protein